MENKTMHNYKSRTMEIVGSEIGRNSIEFKAFIIML